MHFDSRTRYLKGYRKLSQNNGIFNPTLIKVQISPQLLQNENFINSWMYGNGNFDGPKILAMTDLKILQSLGIYQNSSLQSQLIEPMEYEDPCLPSPCGPDSNPPRIIRGIHHCTCLPDMRLSSYIRMHGPCPKLCGVNAAPKTTSLFVYSKTHWRSIL